MAGKTDLELVKEFQNGNVEGFNELVRRYREKVYWIARKVVGTHADADDVVQDVFVRVSGSVKDFRAESGFYTWIYRITINVALNALRKKKFKEFIRYDDFLSESLPDGSRADDELLKTEYHEVLERAIERLPAKQKLVFLMRYYDELPYDEISVILKTSVGGLKANYFHALKKIQTFVRKEMGS